MTNRTISLEDGKYEIVRNDFGLIVDFRRNGEPWPAAMDSFRFSKVLHAALNAIEQLEDAYAVLHKDGYYDLP
jgi:hypothetical protein